MQIDVAKLSKRFQREWIFREMDAVFRAGEPCAITGPNGSGKSTLLRVICGVMPATSGTIAYQQDQRTIPQDQIYRYLSYASPYLELVEELTLREHIDFHFRFKGFAEGISRENFVEKIYLQEALNKQIRFFSSGMKQRLRLGLAFFTNDPIVILDEPTSNLDERGIAWYRENVSKVSEKKLMLIGSNQTYEYDFCKKLINLTDYKLQG